MPPKKGKGQGKKRKLSEQSGLDDEHDNDVEPDDCKDDESDLVISESVRFLLQEEAAMGIIHEESFIIHPNSRNS